MGIHWEITMSWNIDLEKTFDQRTTPTDVRCALAVKGDKLEPEPFHSREKLMEQVTTAISSAAVLAEYSMRKCGLGGSLHILISGHIPENTLNYENFHLSVQITVNPTKHHR
jgi:hypothetical protein